jgi:hypothetical protein
MPPKARRQLVSAGKLEASPVTDALVVPDDTPDPPVMVEELDSYMTQVKWSALDMCLVFDALKDHQQQWIPEDQRELLNTRLSDLNLSTRKEEEAHLRQARPGERACIYGDECQGMKMSVPVVLVEHHTAKEHGEAEKSKEPLQPSMCVMCKRYWIQYFYINSVAETGNIDTATNEIKVVHSHGNYVNMEGEYHVSQCIRTGSHETHGMLVPCVLHVRSWYQPERDTNGLVWFRQVGYRYPGADF